MAAGAGPAGVLAQGRVAQKPARGPGTPLAAGNPMLGQSKADSERCIECHGENGEGAGHSNGPEGKFPKLAAQHPDYLLKQLDDFRSGSRKHDVMGLMARSVEPADLRDIVAFFAGRPAAEGDGVHDPAGQRLYLEGDAAGRIPACASCHGERALGAPGQGGVRGVPRLRGQEFTYLERQLLDWRSGWRRNSAEGVMNAAVAGLSDVQIRQIALYLSGLR
jgi:cytochrome c553